MKLDKLILQMNFLDENIGRLFLSFSNLKESKDIKATIDLTNLQKRMIQFDNYSDWFFNNIDQNTDFDYIKKETEWSLSQVIKYLKLLKPNNLQTDKLLIKNPKTTLNICLYYKDILERILQRLNYLENN